jgi:hypothetical protein
MRRNEVEAVIFILLGRLRDKEGFTFIPHTTANVYTYTVMMPKHMVRSDGRAELGIIRADFEAEHGLFFASGHERAIIERVDRVNRFCEEVYTHALEAKRHGHLARDNEPQNRMSNAA